MRFRHASTITSVSQGVPHAYSLLWSPEDFFAHVYWEQDDKKRSIDPKWRYVEGKLTGTRLQHLEYLRSESLRLRAATDIDTLSALLTGRIEFRYMPEKPEVQAIFERIWHDDVASLVAIAVRDYLVAGIGGLAITPMGVFNIRPELAVAYPNWHRFEWIARLVVVPERYLETVLGKRGQALYRRYQSSRAQQLSEQEPKTELPIGLPCMEVYDRYTLRYYVNGREVNTHDLGGRYNYFLLLGEERTVNEDYVRVGGSVDMQASYPHFTSLMHYMDLQRVQSYPQDWTEDGIELPIGMLERCVRSVYRGYNLYEAHEKLVETILKESLKGRWAFYRFDAFDTESLAFQEFESIFNAIGYHWEDVAKNAPPVQFAGGVTLQDIQIGLRELEQIITSVTGVSPYMLGVVGVTRVASEVVASQQHTNVKLSVQQEKVAQMLARFTRAYQFYLMSLPEEYQRVYMEPIDKPDGLRYVRVGSINKSGFMLPLVEESDYLDFFSRCRIELAYTGQLSLNERRQNYMQAIQLLGSMLQILMQMGASYQLEPIIDRLLKDFGVDLREVKAPRVPEAEIAPPFPAEADSGALFDSLAMAGETPTGVGLSPDLVLPLLQSGAIPEDTLAKYLSPEATQALESLVGSDTLDMEG